MEENKNVRIWIFIAVVLLLLFGSFGMGGYGMMGFGMGFGFIFMLLFLGFIIWFTVNLINTSQSDKKNESDSLTILNRRYASGKITKKQYEEVKKELK